jgi:hypothetical protein
MAIKERDPNAQEDTAAEQGNQDLENSADLLPTPELNEAETDEPQLDGDDFDPDDDERIAALPSVSDESDIDKVPDGGLFLAKFIHDPATDDAWAVKQQMPELLSGRVIRKGMTAEFWRSYSHRSPVAKRTGKNYVVLG